MSDLDIIKNRSAHKAKLDDVGVGTLPDQPGKRGFSAAEVKGHFKAPIDYLFSLMAGNFKEVGSNLDGLWEKVQNINQVITEGVVTFKPALGDTPPDRSDGVNVWLDTGVEDPETLEYDTESNSLTFADTGEAVARASVIDCDSAESKASDDFSGVEVISVSSQSASADTVIDVDASSDEDRIIDI